jgi:signal transduction histidine kinase
LWERVLAHGELNQLSISSPKCGVSAELPIVFAIDDDRDHLDLLSATIADGVIRGQISVALPVRTYSDPADAIAAFPVNKQVIVLIDYHLNDGTALDWLTEIAKRDVGPVLLITSEGGEQVAAQVFRAGVSDYLLKSQLVQTPDSLFTAIKQALRRHKLEMRNRELTASLKVMNEALERRAQHLQELTESAHRFVDDVAHEFRNPLAVIQMSASNVNDGLAGPVTDRQKELLAFINNAARDLAHLIDDFLDSSRLKHGTLRVDRRPHSIEALFKLVHPLLEAHANDHKVRIIEKISPSLPAVFCDLEKAGRALVNFTVNAIKFSTAGAAVEVAAESRPDGEIEIRVIDHGPGITIGDLDKIRARFGQGRNGSTRIKGYGLGLNIAESLVQLNFGRMNVYSVEGAGSTFSFTLCTNDIMQIVRHFLSATYIENPAPHISVLHVGNVGCGVGALREFFSSVCHPMDLVLQLPRADSLLLMGVCDRPQEWISRLCDEWKKDHVKSRELAPSNLYCLGTWKRPELDYALLQCISDRLGFAISCPQSNLQNPK